MTKKKLKIFKKKKTKEKIFHGIENESNKNIFLQLLDKFRIIIFNIIFWFKHIPQSIRITLTLLLVVISIFSLYFISRFGFINPFEINQNTEKKYSNNTVIPDIKDQIAKMENYTKINNPFKGIWKKYKYEELPVYPESWVKRNFTDAEIRNTLLSGPGGDYDGDGLTNKAEFLFGSNPKNKYTLCGTNEGKDFCKFTDKENVDKNISPLTGLEIESNREIIVDTQEDNFIKSIENSFDNASNEGVDFPVLYQKSLLVDYSSELDQISVNTTEFDRQSALEYFQLRIEFLEIFLGNSEQNNQLSSLYYVYKTSKSNELIDLKTKFEDLLKKMQFTDVPEQFLNFHRSLIFIVQNLIRLLNHRYEGIINNDIFTEEKMKISLDLSVKITWGYRQMNQDLIEYQQNNL